MENLWAPDLIEHDGATGGAPHLAIRGLGWTQDGWPVARTEPVVTATPLVGG